MAIHFTDNSKKVSAAINRAIIAALDESASEVVSHAKRNCAMDGKMRTQLRGSYKYNLYETEMRAEVGSPLEAAYWEEFGTGEHAAHKDGRKGWWVYIEGGSGYEGATNSYATEQEAVDMAAWISTKYGVHAVATNGRYPQNTLYNAFAANEAKIRKHFETLLGGISDE